MSGTGGYLLPWDNKLPPGGNKLGNPEHFSRTFHSVRCGGKQSSCPKKLNPLSKEFFSCHLREVADLLSPSFLIRDRPKGFCDARVPSLLLAASPEPESEESS